MLIEGNVETHDSGTSHSRVLGCERERKVGRAVVMLKNIIEKNRIDTSRGPAPSDTT